MRRKQLNAVHPGAIVREEFVAACGLSVYRVAKDLGVTLPRLNDIVREKRGISIEMGLLLARYFQTSDQFFINLQCDFDRRMAEEALGDKLLRVKRYDRGPPG